MATLPSRDFPIDLRAVTVRPTWGAREHRRWDRLVEEHHYLRFHGVIGKGLRHVAVHGETWLALIGWQPGAFKLAARDRWIGWSAEQQFRRLHLIANNSRFVILTPERVPNLASRVLGLSLRRLSADIQAVHGYPALLAETFVDVSRFAGTCYRAANWRSLGVTRGFARDPGAAPRWRHHGQPKEVFVFELTDGAPEALSRVEMPANWSAEQHTEPMAAPRLRSLFECLGEVPEYRHARGKRYALNTILTLAVAARLAGYRGVNAFAQFAALLSQNQLKAVGAFFSPSKQRYTPPAITTFHNVLAALPPETLDNAIGQWTAQQSTAHAPVAMDGKDLRGASRQTENGRRMMVAAVGLVLGQVEVDSKSNEIPAVRELSAASTSQAASSPWTRCTPSRKPRAACSGAAPTMWSGGEGRRPSSKTSRRSTSAMRPGTKPSTRAMAASSVGAVPSSTSPLPSGTATPISMAAARRCARTERILKTGKRSIAYSARRRPRRARGLVRNHWHIAAARAVHLSPLPGLRAPHAPQSCLSDQRRHRHRAQRPLPLPPEEPPLRRPRTGRPCRHPEHARRLIPQAPPRKRAARGASVPAGHARCARKRRSAASRNHRDAGQTGSGLPRTTCGERSLCPQRD